jgi:hypothetical protein
MADGLWAGQTRLKGDLEMVALLAFRTRLVEVPAVVNPKEEVLRGKHNRRPLELGR